MSVLDGVVAGLKGVSASLGEKGLAPDRPRRDWNQAALDALAQRLDAEVLTPFDAAIQELSEDEHRKFRDVVGRVSGSVAAVLGAAGRADEAIRLLRRAEAIAASQAGKLRLHAGSEQLDWHVELAHAEWLQRSGDPAAARRQLERVAKHAPDGLIRSEAVAALREAEEQPEPITSAPSLFTLNGVGTSLYGRSDRRPDGSYVAALCFCVLFIPVFPLSAYRVADAGDRSYYFLGKVRLPRAWRIYRALVAAAVLLGIGGSMIAAELDSPSHRAKNAVAEALALEAKDEQAAARALDAVLTEFHGQVSPDVLAPAFDAWLRLGMKPLPRPVPLAELGKATTLGARIEALGDNWLRERARPLATLYQESAAALGSEDEEHLDGAITLYSAAERILPAREQAAVGERVRALHLDVAQRLYDRWPLAALDHLAQAFPDEKAVQLADELATSIGERPMVLLESEPELAAWMKVTKRAPLVAELRGRLEAARALEKDPARTALLESRDVKRLRQAIATQPDEELRAALGFTLLGQGDVAAAWQVVQNAGTTALLSRDLLELRAMLEFERDHSTAAMELLTAVVDRNLPRLRTARAAFDDAINASRSRLIARAERNDLPRALLQALEHESKEKARERFAEWLDQELEKDATVLAARARYARVAQVANVTVLLGSRELVDAVSATGEARQKLLRRAERHFVAVQAEREGSPEFQLGYGQVLHRLGRAEEGDKLLEAVLANGTAVQRIRVALALRELGLKERAKAAYEAVWRSASQPEKDGAALGLSAMASSPEEEELWLGRVQERTAEVTTRLSAIKARRLAEQGKFAEAARELGGVIAFYERSAAHSAAEANNAAVALLEQYRYTGELSQLDRALAHFRAALRLNPEEALLVSHFAEALEQRLLVQLVEPLVHVKPLRLDSDGADRLIDALLHGPGGDALRARIAAAPALREMHELSAREEALAPSRPEPFIRRAAWAQRLRDDEAFRATMARATGHYDLSEMLSRLERFRRHEQDAPIRSRLEAEFSALAGVTRDAHAPTRATARLERCALGTRLAWVVGDAKRAHESLDECEAARRDWPELVIDLRDELLQTAVLDARARSTKLQRHWEEHARDGDEAVFLDALFADPEMAAALTATPEFKAALAALSTLPDEQLGVRDWVLAHAAHDAELERRVKTELRSARSTEVAGYWERFAVLPPETQQARVALLARARAD
ncbi:MAG: hypothetical protein ACOZQL_09070 [Myxococcota bacterium]